MSTTFQHLPLTQVIAHPGNVRKDLGDLTDLTASIKVQGVLQPIVVAPPTRKADQGLWVIIAGHRRHAAATAAGLTEIPAVIRVDLDTEAKVLLAMLGENISRRELTLMEEADAYHQLELLGVKDAAMAKAVGRTPKTVKDRRLIATLPTARRRAFEDGRLTLEGAIKCARLRDKHATDTEILALIDNAGAWKFGVGSSWGSVEHDIKLLLEARKRPAEPPAPPPAAEDPELAGQTDIDQQIRDQERQAARDHRAALWTRQSAWLTEWLAKGHRVAPARHISLLLACTAAYIEQDSADDELDLAGISYERDEATGELLDYTLDTEHALLLAAQILSPTSLATEPPLWGFTIENIYSRASLLVSLGYEPTPDEIPEQAD